MYKLDFHIRLLTKLQNAPRLPVSLKFTLHKICTAYTALWITHLVRKTGEVLSTSPISLQTPTYYKQMTTATLCRCRRQHINTDSSCTISTGTKAYVVWLYPPVMSIHCRQTDITITVSTCTHVNFCNKNDKNCHQLTHIQCHVSACSTCKCGDSHRACNDQ